MTRRMVVYNAKLRIISYRSSLFSLFYLSTDISAKVCALDPTHKTSIALYLLTPTLFDVGVSALGAEYDNLR